MNRAEPVDPEAPGADASRLALVSRWADDLAHEIKNPLHAMVINLELVKRRAEGGDPDAVVERAEIVEAELHRVHDLIDSLLRLVRPWPDVATADIEQILEAFRPVFTARARVRRITYEHAGPGDGGGDRVAVPPGDLAHLVVALIDRAIDCAAEEGRLETAVSTDEDAAELTVTVTDGDTRGADLAAVRSLVELAGGSLVVEDDERGGRFIVRLARGGSA